jgi:integrase
MHLDTSATIGSDIGKGGRANGKETMARRRYQEGCLFTRGRVGRKVWVARWREDAIGPDGAIMRMMRSQVLGPVSHVPTRREARQLLSSLLRPTNQGLRKPQATMTFGDFVRKWQDAVLPTYRASTRNFYRDILRGHLVPKFASHRLCDIHTPDVQIFLNQKAERYSPSVLQHIRATLSRTFASAKEWGYVESNPALGVRLPRKRAVRPKITFEPSQVARILEALEEPYRTIVLLDAVTGMRASELFALQWSDVDFERRLLFIRRTYYRGEFGLPKSENSERAIPLSPGLVAALQHHRQHVQRSSMDLVFPNARGKPYEPNNLVMRVLHPTLNALGLTKTGWRAFRRSVATALSEMREPVRTAQQILGHASAQTTLAYYVQSVEESQRNAIARLEKIMSPIVPKCSQVRGKLEAK